MHMVQAKYWSCLHGLVPAAPPAVPVSTDYSLYSQVNTDPAAAQYVAVAAQQPFKSSEELSPFDIGNGDDFMHSNRHGEHGAILEDDINKNFPGRCSQPRQDMSVHNVGSRRASSGVPARLHEPCVGNANEDNGQQSEGQAPLLSLGTFLGTASHDAVLQVHSPEPRCVQHAQTADQTPTHGHRLLADGQEPQAHASKPVHRTKPSPQMCQSKSHRHLLLMRALHVSARKQMKRQQRHASHVHARNVAVEITRQKSI